ncbi:uncharacterized protein Z520_09710 [Fonsecaea multimorphosa CBS 102226]|uniref:Uncharacterized protein n=1 Tax=Fonsecaea multimorphosa CBS 102226 TaxID=1442371 RepID=A0A0D2JVY4_9EURO|nr:uncharacterized protein Z520_09710 [Fonsecaea multimorphosa CBS 102226]KIX94664.1 hypothetical protein Z520_09710 [Fonsecaea multimorphosa CBS 102226]OAL20189.1 hypothetical protein AYO22_09083 [Fonsecaea multimorphosa]
MKSFVAASLLALVGAAAAAPSTLRFAKRENPDNSCGPDPGSAAIANAINQWNSDVVTVNSFLDEAASLDTSTLLVDLETALTAAQDEPNQLNVLACESDVAGTPAQTAANDLFNGFENNVLVPLGNIIANPSDANNVAMQLQTINQFRCCHVLPDLDVLWSGTAEDEGVANIVPITAPRPNTCASISC